MPKGKAMNEVDTTAPTMQMYDETFEDLLAAFGFEDWKTPNFAEKGKR